MLLGAGRLAARRRRGGEAPVPKCRAAAEAAAEAAEAAAAEAAVAQAVRASVLPPPMF